MALTHAELERALALAAEGPRATLQGDREHFESLGDSRVAAVLDYLRKGPARSSDATEPSPHRPCPALFLSGVTAVTAARAGGSNERSVSRQLRAYNGQSLFEYMSALRFETATNWLRAYPQLEVDVIAEWVGLTGWRLRRLCREWLGQTPTSCSLPEPPLEPRDPAAWQRVVNGRLPQADQQVLAAYVRATWPAAYEAAMSKLVEPNLASRRDRARVVDRDALAKSVAQGQLWALLSGLSYSAQRELIALYPFTTTAFFDLLRQKSREEGCRDRQRGIELAELALLSLDVSAPALGEKIQELRALGWAWLGNARRLALDFPGAEKDFERAMKELALVEGWADSLVAAKIYALKAALHIFRRRFKEALKLLDYSLVIFEKVGDQRRLIEGLMTRAAAADYAGCSEAAVSNLEAALGIAKALKDEDFRIKVSVNLGMALVNWNRFEDGASVIKSFGRHVCYQVDPRLAHLVQWIEGIVQHGLGNPSSAEEKYLAAYAGFEGMGDLFYATFVDLDIAILYAETGKATEVCRIAAAILSFFEALSLSDEALVSLRLLKDTLRSQAVSEAVLRRVRSALRGDPLAAIVSL